MWKLLILTTCLAAAVFAKEEKLRHKRQLSLRWGLNGFGTCLFSRNPWLCRNTQFIPSIPINRINQPVPVPAPTPSPVVSGILFGGLLNCFLVPIASRSPGVNCNFPTVNRQASALNVLTGGLQATGAGGTPVVASGLNTGGAVAPSGVGATGPGGAPIAVGTNGQGVNCALIPDKYRAQSGCPLTGGLTANRILTPVAVPAPVPSPLSNRVGISLKSLKNALNVIRGRMNSRTTTVATPTVAG